MRPLAASLAFMLVLIPVNLSVNGHHLWAGAAFGAWGWLASTMVRWSAQ